MKIPIYDSSRPRQVKTPKAPDGKRPLRKRPEEERRKSTVGVNARPVSGSEYERPRRPQATKPTAPPKRKPSTEVVAKPVTTEVAVVPETKGKAPKIGKTDLSNMRSIIGDKVEDIQALLADGKFETATQQMHTVLLQTLVDIIPYAENAIRASEGTKGVYQINSLAAMILETLSSARSQSDRGQLAHHLVERVLQPAFKVFAESLVREFMALDADLSTAQRAQVPGIIRDTRSRLADSLQSTYTTMRTETLKFLGG